MYKAIPLPYEYSELEPFIDTETMNIHYNKHYKTYIDNLNNEFVKLNYKIVPIQNLIYNIDNYSDTIRNNAGGFYNHSLFWQMLKSPSKKQGYLPYGISSRIIKRDFDNFDIFKNKIIETAKKRFGSGWVWWILNTNGTTEIVETPYQDNPQMYIDCEILLGIDVWEHAYYLKYQADRVEYVNNIFNVINWDYPNKILNQYFH
jgi:Fe-Mn family superoxide dismutase